MKSATLSLDVLCIEGYLTRQKKIGEGLDSQGLDPRTIIVYNLAFSTLLFWLEALLSQQDGKGARRGDWTTLRRIPLKSALIRVQKRHEYS